MPISAVKKFIYIFLFCNFFSYLGINFLFGNLCRLHASLLINYLIHSLLIRNIKHQFDVFFARGIRLLVLASPIVLTLPVGLFPIWVSWPLARGSFAYCLSRLLFFLLFSVVYYNLEHPDKNRVLKF